ncbi:uncharacterized protein LOC122378743 [Amphibalanus amphitrite]|uniref:uncharacterized protein LOC122378743 n=1 Tax=Amphibalanus amphitrite TaxID=1232801 RepID=UPI001C8FEBD5|nr:uncharacterized protein LOC122378743 [Amphibalanus amphitrite]
MTPRRLLLLLAVLAAARGQPGRTADPSSCRRYLEGADGTPVTCPEPLLFDTASGRCMPAPVATCGSDMDAPPSPVRAVIRKCCPESQQFDLSVGDCVDREGPWQPTIYAHSPFNATAPTPVESPEYDIRAERLQECTTIAMNMDPEYPDVLYPLDNGFLYVPAFQYLYSPDAYCIETIAGTGVPGGPVLGGVVCKGMAEETPGITALPDDRPVVPRCCARFIPLDLYRECRFDLQMTSEPAPPLEEAAAGADAVRYEITRPLCNGTDMVFLRMGAEPFAIDSLGTLPLPEANLTIPLGDFCLNEGLPTGPEDAPVPEPAGATALLCPSVEQRAALDATSVRKCCPPGMEVERVVHAEAADEMNCVPSGRTLEVDSLEEVAVGMRAAPLLINMPPCEGGLFEVTTGNFSVREDGSFQLIEFDPYACHNQAIYKATASTYCLDRKVGSERPVHAFYCFPEQKPDDTNVNYIFYPILMGITDFFLLVTFIVYLTVPDPTQTGLNKKRKLSQSVLGMILLAYISSLFFAYLVLMIVQTAVTQLTKYRVACKVLAVILYFFLLSAFYWLSVICFEIYLSTRADKRTSGRKRFRLYAVYAWGCPLLMASLALIMDLAPGIDNCSVIKPAFGRYRCLFQNRKAFIAYFYIPIGVLLAICLLLYILTVKNLSVPSKMPGKDASSAMSKQSAKQQGKRRKLCAKLFLIMGITWVAELLSYLIGDSPVWYFFDVINILQGFFIFVAFILRPKVLQYIKKTALQSLSRSFGHDSQHDGHQRGGAGGGAEAGAAARAPPAVSSPATMSTRVASTRTNSGGSGTGTAASGSSGSTGSTGTAGSNGAAEP